MLSLIEPYWALGTKVQLAPTSPKCLTNLARYTGLGHNSSAQNKPLLRYRSQAWSSGP